LARGLENGATVSNIAAEVLKADKPGTAIKWLTTPKAAWRFIIRRVEA
jgi:hypothetical protein